MIIDGNTTHDEIDQQQSRKAVVNKCHQVDQHIDHSVMTYNVKPITEGERSSLALEIETQISVIRPRADQRSIETKIANRSIKR